MEISVDPTDVRAAWRAAEWMTRRIRSAVRLRGTCRVAVSGGSTPALMFERLAELDVPWPSVQLFQVDERVAPDGDPARNAVQLASCLLDRVPIRRSSVHLMPVTAPSLARAAARYAALLVNEPLDIVHLGLGDDGHTASWPPGDPVVDSQQQVAITGVFNGHVRMTLTPPAVNGARARVVLATGANKAAPIAGWLLHRADLPIERVRRSHTTLVTDAAGAAQLTPHAQVARYRR